MFYLGTLALHMHMAIELTLITLPHTDSIVCILLVNQKRLKISITRLI